MRIQSVYLPAFAVFLAIGAWLGCSESEGPSYAAPARSDGELRAELGEACRQSRARGGRILVEFSAPWCSDCQRLQELKKERALADELERWPSVTINVGMFDLHRDLLDRFGIEKIANWSIFAPTDCAAPFEGWPRVITRTLEPASGAERGTSSEQLAAWLRGFRRS